MEDGDRFPARRRAFEHIDAGLPAVFDTNRVLGYTKPLIGVEDHVCRLLAQQRHVLYVLIAGKHKQPVASLIVSHALDGHVHLIIHVARKQQLHARALLDALEFACRKRRDIIPRGAADELSDRVFRNGLGRNGVVVLRGHGLQLLRRQDAFISVRHAGVGSGVVGGDGTGVGCRLSLQAGQLVLYGLELRVDGLAVCVVGQPAQHQPLELGG